MGWELGVVDVTALGKRDGWVMRAADDMKSSDN